MNPRILVIAPKKLIGTRLAMSFANNKTGELWRSFVPRRKEIVNNLNNELISMAIYQPNHFSEFHPANEFEKWASVQVTDFGNIPVGMESFTLAGGLYAVFDYKGSSNDTSIFQYIFGEWLPGSAYKLDDRPHFEVLGEKYRNNDPASEEEIWIPISPR